MFEGGNSLRLRGICTGCNIVLVLAGIALIFAPTLTEILAYDRQAILSGELWRLWTGHLVHYGLRHALIDVGVLALVIVLSWRETGAVFTALTLLLGMPLIALGLLLCVPGLHEYRGASGIDILLAVALGVRIWRDETMQASGSRPGVRSGLSLLGLFLILKIMLEALGMTIGVSDLPAGIRVVWEAHALGAVIGVLLAWVWGFGLSFAPGIFRSS